jgi:hypothetical protein
MIIITISFNMTIFGLSGDDASKSTNKNETRIDPPAIAPGAIAAIVSNKAETSDFRD